MPTLIKKPSVVEAAGSKSKLIEEFVGRVNTGTDDVSIARMKSPDGWLEPGQKPDFDEYTLVLRGMLRVSTETETVDVRAGQAVIVHAGEWVQYSTPERMVPNMWQYARLRFQWRRCIATRRLEACSR